MFYVLAATRAQLRERGRDDSPLPNLAALLDLVALGTVADVVRLDHTNRILVEQGLARIRAGRAHAGVAALFAVAGRDARRDRDRPRLRRRPALTRTRERLDSYTLELQRHGLESVEREVRWLTELIDDERGRETRDPGNVPGPRTVPGQTSTPAPHRTQKEHPWVRFA